MCTAVSFNSGDLYFGRTLDHTCSYGENVVITPRNFPLQFRHTAELRRHYAIIGMAHVAAGYPLYYDGINEKGLAMAGLNFVGYARYGRPVQGKDNIAQFEMIPWVLGQCASATEARRLLAKINVADTPFCDDMPAAELHWMIADKDGALVVEADADGLHVYDNPAGVMTNNPEFPWHMRNLSRYMNLVPGVPQDNFGGMGLEVYSNGLGAVGLPGDISSPSRFVRAAFMRHNSVCGGTERENVSRFFHIMAAVEQTKGCCITSGGAYMYTLYTSCCNADSGIYYYRTYDGERTISVDMHGAALDGSVLVRHEMIME